MKKIFLFALLVFSSFAGAETISTSTFYYPYGGLVNDPSYIDVSASALCTKMQSHPSVPAARKRPFYMLDSYRCLSEASENSLIATVSTISACPPNQNWTKSGSSCIRSDCVSPQIRNSSTGVCEASPCQAGESVTSSVFRGWSIGPGEAGIVSSPVSSACDGQCTFSFQTVNSCTGGGGSVDAPKPIFCNYTGLKTGAQCSTSPTETGLAPTVPQHPSPCAIGEGVMTSSTGKVLCVPAGTPTAETPKTGKAESTKTNADGSKTTTTTTTTCTGAGSCSSTTTTTTTGAGGGSTPGEAGTPGTKTETKDTNQEKGTADPDGCDPTKQMCGSPATSGLYSKKSETFSGPLSRFTDGLKTSALTTNATGFFNVSVPSAGCPNWSISQTVLGKSFVADMRPVFCSSTALTALDAIGFVLMAVAAFAAFRVAML